MGACERLGPRPRTRDIPTCSGMEMMSWFSTVWYHSEFREFLYPVWSGLERCSSSQLSTVEEKRTACSKAFPRELVAHHFGCFWGDRWKAGVTGAVEVIRLTESGGQDIVKPPCRTPDEAVLFCSLGRLGLTGQTQPHSGGLTGTHNQSIV